jgi:hypothetical protein
MVLTMANSSSEAKIKQVQLKNQMSSSLMLLTLGRSLVPALCVSVMNVSHVDVPANANANAKSSIVLSSIGTFRF